MPGLSYDGRRFRATQNSATGEAGEATVFASHQDGSAGTSTLEEIETPLLT